ncbi:MAG: hypothetical protein GTO55_09490 [Armatimonadetes bacterium]|nr:hypothetical protein [Armatimonadota bacterium]NIM24480.1 hypothetical protein [Armatimonadota bacterium]NIM68351.1 hypothetical protein [Armatimonadota bacterium]NIM76755.1 hypothetical protein [Armatimonadota bacterium]NIN06554.1 hypothetical protein [Armatimonadota bacterium]
MKRFAGFVTVGKARITRAIILPLLGLVLLWPFARQSATEEPVIQGELATIIEGLQQREQQVWSARGDFLEETTFNKDPELLKYIDPDLAALHPASDAVKVIWGFEGRQFRQETVKLDIGQASRPELPESRKIEAFDAEKGYYYESGTGYAMEVLPDRLSRAGIEGNFGHWLYLSHKYGTGRPLSQELIEKKAVVVGREVVNGIDCYHLFAPPSASGISRSWWIAPNLDFALVREELLLNQLSTGSTVQNVSNAEYLKYGGIWLPMKRDFTVVTRFSDGKEFWVRKAEASVLSLEVNQPISQDFFQPEYASGTHVHGIAGLRVIE